MPVGELWSDQELEGALEAYLYALRLEQSGVRLPEQNLITALKQGPLKLRNRASIRYRLRNISSVLEKLGYQTIAAYPPAAKVGSGVESRLKAMLPSAIFGLPIAVQPEPLSARSANDLAIDALHNLAAALRDLDSRTAGLGHNNPPEEIEPGTMRGDLRRAISAIEDLRQELTSAEPREDVVRIKTVEIAQSGAGWAAWFGARGTKAVDAAIATVVPVALLGLAALALKLVIALADLFPGIL